LSQVKRVVDYDKTLSGLEKRAGAAEIFLCIAILIIVNIALFFYCKFYNKKKNDNQMQVAVNEQVSQYFALAAEDSSATNEA